MLFWLESCQLICALFARAQCNEGLVLDCLNTLFVNLTDCLTAGIVSMVENDQAFGSQFDNNYYQRLTDGYGLFTSDVTLFRDPQTKGLVEQFAQVCCFAL